MDYILCIVNDIFSYESRYIGNPILQANGLKCVPLLNKNESTHGHLYNIFFDNIPDDAEWIALVTDSIEFREEPFKALKGVSRDRIYGVFGGRIVRNGSGRLLQEFIGRVTICEEGRTRVYHNKIPSIGEIIQVDALDSRCIILHADILRRHSLRFDRDLNILYGEDFCLQAFDMHSLQSCVCSVDCALHENLFYPQGDLTEDLLRCGPRFAQAKPRAGAHAVLGETAHVAERVVLIDKPEREASKIYSRTVDQGDVNLPIVIASRMLKSNVRVLDAGCATGDNGYFLRQTRGNELYGMEYDAPSLALAHSHGVYTELHQVDLNTMQPSNYQSYYRFFDAILLLDVLEHLYDPMRTLQKMSVFLKENGSFIISLPNIAHAHPVLGLCNKEFNYRDYGILDSTHIRFFTWKSMAKSLASWGFYIEESYAVFRAPNTSNMNAPVSVPLYIIESLLEDPHSLVCQYVCKVSPSDASYSLLRDRNLTSLERSPHNNPEGWNLMGHDLHKFKRKVALAFGYRYPSVEVRQIKELMKQERYIEAVLTSRLFDEEWYRDTYDDVDFSAQHPLEHYLTQGWREGKNPSEAFDQGWYQSRFETLLAHTDICPLLFHLSYALNAELPHNIQCLTTPDTELVRFAKHVIHGERDYFNTFEALDETPFAPAATDPKVVAFYLPQFSPFPENDLWWGKGFTEWTNVTKALPLYPGHYQPHLPYDLGFYDLRVRETCLRQEELANLHGIHGFCYHYYWFDGKKIMNDPIEKKLADQDMRLPFCISWANEAWSANWDGSQNNLLIGQPQDIQTEKLFYDLLPYFKDSRYICVEGEPFFMIYRPTYFERRTVRRFIADFRRLAAQNGLPGLHIALGKTLNLSFPIEPLQVYGADSYVEFPPHRFTYERILPYRLSNNKAKADLYDMQKIIPIYKTKHEDGENTYRTVFPMWDNTARKAESGATIFTNTTPEVYARWLSWCLQRAGDGRATSDPGMVFVNAWNEWAEGAHLEPDRKYGYAFLNKTKMAIYAARKTRR